MDWEVKKGWEWDVEMMKEEGLMTNGNSCAPCVWLNIERLYELDQDIHGTRALAYPLGNWIHCRVIFKLCHIPRCQKESYPCTWVGS